VKPNTLNPTQGAKGSLRIARMEASPSDHLDHMKSRVVPKWVHLECCAAVILQEAADRYKAIENVPGYEELEQDDQSEVLQITANILEGIEAAPKTEKIAKKASSAKASRRKKP
jgi:hypothetical protein